jgi:hypothetical protein
VQYTWIAAVVLSIVFCVIWPLLTIPAGVFSYEYFYFWVVLSIIWGLVSAFISTFMPLWESRDVFARCAPQQLWRVHQQSDGQPAAACIWACHRL